jgi:hypothetical protein
MSESWVPLVLMGLAMSWPMAAWRDEHDCLVRDVVCAFKAALRAANLSQQEAAACLDTARQSYAESQFSLDMRRGCNLAAMVVIASRCPVFGAALWHRLRPLFEATPESDVARRERLLQELDDLNRSPRKAITCLEHDSHGSSVA